MKLDLRPIRWVVGCYFGTVEGTQGDWYWKCGKKVETATSRAAWRQRANSEGCWKSRKEPIISPYSRLKSLSDILY